MARSPSARELAGGGDSRQTVDIAKPPHDPFSIAPDPEADLELELADPVPLEPRASVPVASEVKPAPPKRPDIRGGTSAHDDSLPSKGDSYAERQASLRQQYWMFTRIPVILLLAWFTYSHLSLKGQWVFIDGVNLLFHEAGHTLYSWGGETLHALGGTLGQLMWPFGLGIYFALKRKDYFASAACVWWFGENLVGIARYVNDAIAEALPLVGGNQHDWNYLLSKWGKLNMCGIYADRIRFIGLAMMIGAIAFMIYRTWRPSEQDLEAGFKADE